MVFLWFLFFPLELIYHVLYWVCLISPFLKEVLVVLVLGWWGFFFRTWSIFSHSLLFCKVYALKSADSIEGALLWLMASSGCFENSLIVPDIWQFDSPVSQSRFLIFFLLFEDVLSVCFVETPALFFYCSPDPMMTIITVILNHLSVNSYIPHFPFFLTLCIAVFT